MKKSQIRTLLTLMLALALLTELPTSAEGLIDTVLGIGTTQAFTDAAVSDDDLNAILRAGLSAASAINQQPWHFVALTNRELMTEISSSMGEPGAPAGNAPTNAEGFTPPANTNASDGADDSPGAPAGMPAAGTSAKAALGDSPLAIILYMDENTASTNAAFDCGLACQNMVVAANALGYGTKIVSSPTIALNGDQHDALCEKLGVDTSLQAVAVLLVGHADDAVDGFSGATTRDSLDEKVSFVP